MTGPALVGATITLADVSTEALFGEAPTRVVVSIAAAQEAELSRRATAAGVPLTALGRTGGDSLSIAHTLTVPATALREARDRCLESIVGA